MNRVTCVSLVTGKTFSTHSERNRYVVATGREFLMEGAASRASLTYFRVACTAANFEPPASVPISLGLDSTWRTYVQSVTWEKSDLV